MSWSHNAKYVLIVRKSFCVCQFNFSPSFLLSIMFAAFSSFGSVIAFFKGYSWLSLWLPTSTLAVATYKDTESYKQHYVTCSNAMTLSRIPISSCKNFEQNNFLTHPPITFIYKVFAKISDHIIEKWGSRPPPPSPPFGMPLAPTHLSFCIESPQTFLTAPPPNFGSKGQKDVH